MGSWEVVEDPSAPCAPINRLHGGTQGRHMDLANHDTHSWPHQRAQAQTWSWGQGSRVEGERWVHSLCYPACPLHPTNGPCLQVRARAWPCCAL